MEYYLSEDTACKIMRPAGAAESSQAPEFGYGP